MQEAGINTGLFSRHSYRSAATSKTDASGTRITIILQSASCSRTSTFKKFYLNDIQQIYPNPKNEDTFGRNLLYVHSNNTWDKQMVKGKIFCGFTCI